jgi:hypothetical protein
MNRNGRIVHLMRGVAVATLLLGVLGVGAWWQFGSLANASLYLRGHDHVVVPTVVDVGKGAREEKRSVMVYVRNLSFQPIRIVGADTTCNCLIPKDLPITIPPRKVVSVEFSIYLTAADGEVRQMATLLFDEDGRLRETPVVILGKCPPAAKDTSRAG